MQGTEVARIAQKAREVGYRAERHYKMALTELAVGAFLVLVSSSPEFITVAALLAIHGLYNMSKGREKLNEQYQLELYYEQEMGM